MTIDNPNNINILKLLVIPVIIKMLNFNYCVIILSIYGLIKILIAFLLKIIYRVYYKTTLSGMIITFLSNIYSKLKIIPYILFFIKLLRNCLPSTLINLLESLGLIGSWTFSVPDIVTVSRIILSVLEFVLG